MIIERKYFSKKENNTKSKLAGITTSPAGIGLLKNSNSNGEISGRVRLYHGTNENAKKSILKEGLRGEKALDPNNLTNTVIDDIGRKDGRKLVYTSKKKTPAEIMSIINQRKGRGKAAILKLSIPYDEYKDKFKKMRVYDNPEFHLRGVKTEDDLVREQLKGFRSNNVILRFLEKKKAKDYWNNFSGAKGTTGTRIFEGDIESKYIKGGKGYKKNSLKEIIKYAKKNPKRFLKGSGKALAGLSLLGGGVAIATKDSKKK